MLVMMSLVVLPASHFSLLLFFLVEVAFAFPALTLYCLSFVLLGIDVLLANVVGRTF